MKRVVIFSGLLFFSLSGLTQNFVEIMKAVPSDRADGDQFGNAVDVDGDYAIVAAYSDNFGGSENHGSVYIYKRNGINDWVQHQKLIAGDQEDYDRFGWSVSIDGNYAIVGAYREDEDANGTNALSNAGSAYIFENDGTGNWTQVEKIVASDRAVDDEFGWSVSISGNTAIVGARAEDHNVAGGAYIYSSGSVYVFNRDGLGNWTQAQKICAADRAADINYPGGYTGEDLGDQFGWAVSISGNYLVVGALHHDYAVVSPPSGVLWSSGAAYIFERTAGVWNQVQKIQNFDREAWDRFGCAVDIDTNVLVVGAYSEDELADGVSGELTNPGSAYIYERSLSGTWMHKQKIVPNDRSSGDHFGYSFALRDTLLVVGTHSDNNDEFAGAELEDAGSAYIFEKNAGVWSQMQKIDASDRAEYDEFGISVGLSEHTIVIGAYFQDADAAGANAMTDAGAAYFFSNQNCPVLITNQTYDLCFGESFTIGSNTYSASGNYSDLFVSYEGCDSTVNTTLNIQPQITSASNLSVCYGTGANIGGTYYTTAGTYPAVYTAVNGCDSTDFVTLSFQPEIISSTPLHICYGSGVNIGGTYYTTAGSYPVVYTAVNGCDSTAFTTLIIDPENTATQTISICYGESYTIGLNTYTVSGVYTDVITASNFCDSVITTNLTVQLPVNKALNQDMNYLTALANGATYQWIDCTTDLPIIGQTGKVFAAPTTGSYAVIVTENGCTDTSACVYVDVINAGIFSDEFNRIEIYPNPNNGNFVIKMDAQLLANSNVMCVNAVGEEILLVADQQGLATGETLAPGVYVLMILNERGIFSRKIIVQ